MCLMLLTQCRERIRSVAQLSFCTTNSMQHLILGKYKQCREKAVESAGLHYPESLHPPKGGACLCSRVTVTAGPCSPLKGEVMYGSFSFLEQQRFGFCRQSKRNRVFEGKMTPAFYFIFFCSNVVQLVDLQEQCFLVLIFIWGWGGKRLLQTGILAHSSVSSSTKHDSHKIKKLNSSGLCLILTPHLSPTPPSN